MSNHGYDVVSSDDETDQPQTQTTCAPFKRHRGYPIERKVVDGGGGLGSLYDTRTDKLVDRHSVQAFQSKRLNKRYVCKIFSGDSSRQPIRFLADIGFSDLLRQHIHQQTVTPSGVSRFVEYTEPINQNTRFLYYAYRDRQDKLSIDARKADRIVAPPSGQTQADYMITKIIWGFEILCVIPTANNQSINAVDQVLNYTCRQLQNNQIPIQFNNAERRLINQLNRVTVFGTETCINDPNTSLLTIFDRIQNWQNNSNFHQPIEYIMQPLRWLYGPLQFGDSCASPDRVKRQKSPRPANVMSNGSIDRNRVKKFQSDDAIQAKLQRIDVELKEIGEIFYNFPSNFPSPILNQRLRNFRQHYRLLLDRQEQLKERIQELTPGMQQQRHKSTVLDNLLTDSRYQCLHEVQLKDFRTNVERLLAKSKLIQRLENDQVEYINAMDVCIDARIAMTNEAIDNYLRRSFANEPNLVILWYSGDRLQREHEKKWNEIYRNLTAERHTSKELIRLHYVDFTQCQQRLENFVIVRLPEYQDDNRRRPDIQPQSQRARSAPSTPKPLSRRLVEIEEPDSSSAFIRRSKPSPIQQPDQSSQSSLLRKRPASDTEETPDKKIRVVKPPPPPPPKRRTEINVLLLGETGVGKSTFINAFVNYLKFETLEQAERGEPDVLIPVSFLITIGDQFEEFIVRFGNTDSNEDHEHEGQSVTQHCKSYIFDLNNQTSLRIIDTPGIGDTRGVAQDAKNIDHTLTYINTLPHLNAVCLLLKPNASRLNVFFRSCIHQLLTYLTPIGYENIIFCFTNARSTFYAPGDTGRLLREMLNQERLDGIPFKRDNTFCFDSESFRYLAARKCGVDFDDYQKIECKNSWNTSVAESIRLLKFIQTRQPYYLEEWQSPRKATLDISMLARPLMETLRLIIYNWKMTEAKLVFNQLILNAHQVDIEMCTHCATTSLVEKGPFWITQYQPAILRNNTNQHLLCRLDGNGFLIESLIQHDLVKEGAGLRNEKWQSSFHNFLLKCDRIQHFLRQQGPLVQQDPFGPIIDRFLEEEEQIAQIRNINSLMNRRVREILQSIRQIRQRNSQQLFDNNESLSVRQVYEIIDEFMRMPTVKQQVQCIKTTRQSIMSKYEHRISTNVIKNKTFT